MCKPRVKNLEEQSELLLKILFVLEAEFCLSSMAYSFFFSFLSDSELIQYCNVARVPSTPELVLKSYLTHCIIGYCDSSVTDWRHERTRPTYVLVHAHYFLH